MSNTVSVADVKAYVAGLSPEMRLAFDPGWTEGGGHTLPYDILCERAEAYLQYKADVDAGATTNRPVLYTVGDDVVGRDAAASFAEQRERAQNAMTDSSEEAQRMARHRARRSVAVRELCDQLLIREEPGPRVQFVTIAQLNTLVSEYGQARQEGETDDALDFLPLSAYHTKLFPVGRKPIRHLFENECGIFQMASNPSSPLAGCIVCVRDQDLGTGTGLGNWTSSHVVVPETIEPAPEAPPQLEVEMTPTPGDGEQGIVRADVRMPPPIDPSRLAAQLITALPPPPPKK